MDQCFSGGSVVKNLPAKQEMQIRSLGQEEPLEEEMEQFLGGGELGEGVLALTRHSVQFSRSVMSDSLQPHGLYPTRLLYPLDFPGKNTGVGCHFLLQGIFPTQESNSCLLLGRQILYH